VNKKDDELQSWLTLWRVPGVGSQRFHHLLNLFGSPQHVLAASTHQLTKAGISKELAAVIAEFSPDNAQPDMDWLAAEENRHIISIHDERYPDLLKQIDSPPALLYVQGDPSLLSDPQLAIVGSRNPTQYGRDIAYQFSRHLASAGLCITSGLALGIDGHSHKGALDADGVTIAVTATGLDRIYPARHKDLAHAIGERGVIVSEYPIGTPVRAQSFPRRNRIISGLSLGTLVVEAAVRSGSLITARYASEQGREVFAIPGSIHNPLSRGCHHLLRQGAKLVETGEHILEELAPHLRTAMKPAEEQPSVGNEKKNADDFGLDGDQKRLLDVMGYEPIPVDQMVVQTGLTTEAVSSMLLVLELQGHITAYGGGLYIRSH